MHLYYTQHTTYNYLSKYSHRIIFTKNNVVQNVIYKSMLLYHNYTILKLRI